jgi:hypothetical protein
MPSGSFYPRFRIGACADAIIPYMAIPWGQLFLLPAVVFIEGLILNGLLGGGMLAAMFQSLLGNIASTALGAALYLATMPLVGDKLFQWWFKGGFASEAIRNACIALGFAVGLFCVSWVSETIIVAHLRRTTYRSVGSAAAVANLATYILLLGLALWFQH